MPIRIQRHLRRLGLYSGRDYLEWCRSRGFEAALRKSWVQLEREWCAHQRESARAQARTRVDRDPQKLIARVCAGSLAAEAIDRPRWRALAERIERAELRGDERRALCAIVDAAVRRGRLVLAESEFAGERHPFIDAFIRLARHHGDWLRGPAGWRPRTHNADRQLSSLMRHLLARYPVPQLLDAAWVRADDDAATYRAWFLATGRGESLRHTPGPIAWTKRIAHHFLAAPSQLSIEQALRWGQVCALGGDDALARAIVATRLGEGFEHDGFWSSVIRFFAAHPCIERDQVGPTIDYLHEQRFVEVEQFIAPGVRAMRGPARPHLSMRGRCPHALLREVERWHRQLARTPTAGPQSWPSSDIAPFELAVGRPGANLHVWRIRELLSHAALRAEGTRMRHCVAIYGGSCAAGRCSIWSMERVDFEGTHPRVTIEVTQSRKIVQVRGRANRAATKGELALIQRWADQEGLRIAIMLR